MKILSLHINNYGKFSNYDLNFDEFTTICENNGYGKSTLSSFIKAMFYGLDKLTASSVKFLDRKHYYPFKGGVFGGNIVFEYNGKKYRIERTFDAKSNTKDTMNVYCNDTQDNNCLGPVPGNTVFGINKESFDRLISINSDKITIETDDDINSKLNNYVENIGEDFDIEIVKNQIKKVTKANKDKMKELQDKNKDINNEIEKEEYLRKSLEEEMYDKLNNAQEDKNKAEKKYELAMSNGTVVEQWKNYQGMVETIKDKERLKKEYETNYSSIPSKEMLDNIKEEETKKKEVLLGIQNNVLDSIEAKTYEELSEVFRDKDIPSDEKLESIKKEITEYEKLSDEIDKYDEKEETPEETELNKHFYGETIESINGILSQLEEEIDNYKKISVKLFESSVTVNNNKDRKNPAVSTMSIILGVILLIVGVVVITNNITIGIILILLGMLLLGFAGLTNIKNTINNSSNTSIGNKTVLLEQEKALKNQIINHFARYKYDDDNPEVLLSMFKRDFDELKKNNKKRNDEQKKYEANTIELNKISKRLDSFFSEFGLNDYYSDSLENLKNKITTFNLLNDSLKRKKKENQKSNEVLNEIIEKIKGFRDEFGIDDTKNIDEVENDIREIERLNREITDEKNTAEKYRIENNLVEKPRETGIDLEELKEFVNEKTNEYNEIKHEVEKIEEMISNLDDLKNEFDNNKEILGKLKEKALMYEYLSIELDKADQTLKEKYIAPIKKQFVKYANLLEDAIGEKISMDKNYKISFEREGELRSYEHLSNGNLTICALCFRLAILDNMFEGDLPFILMDDPFVHLDKNHFEKTRKLIEELAKNKQIIYFCCHESRKL